tara:strand:+ start:1926 stop:4592 length:2667 start_codon:yes stop_codon:yes gene_type:complete
MADNKLRFFLTGDSKQFQQSLTQAENKLKAFGSKMQSVGRSMTMFAAPVVAAGAASIKMAASFDKSMTKIKTLVGEASEDVDGMRAAVIQMAKDTGSSADEAAEALFFITSAGIKGDEAMKVLNASLKASAIGLGNVATVADSATSAMNAYGSENLSATMATDVLTNSVRLGKLSSEELAGSIGQVIPIASNLGVQFHEVGATLAAMSRTGTNAATASMQLKNILLGILNPSKEAADQLESMGLSSQMLRQQIKDKGLLSVLQTLKKEFDNNKDAQAKVFGSSRALMGVMDLLGKGFKDTTEIFDGMSKSAGVTAEAYEELQKSAEFKLRKSMVQVKETFREVGATLLEALLPSIQSASEFIVKLLKGFNGLSDNTKTFLGIVTMLATALGPLLIVFGSLITSVGTIIGAIKSSTIAMKLLNLAMSANPAIKFATIILGAAAALFKLGKARKEAEMEALNKELNDLSIEDAEKRLASLSTTLAANTKIIDDNNKLSFTRRKHLLEDADGNRVATRKIVSKNKAMSNEIQMLKEIIQKKKDMAKADEEIANITKLGTTTGGGGGTGTSGPTPEDIAKQTAAALLTTKKKQFDAEIAATTAHYDNLIKLNEGNAGLQKQLETSKGEALQKIRDGFYDTDVMTFQEFSNKKKAVEQQIADATAITEDQRKALEVEKTKQFYAQLMEQAVKFKLGTEQLQTAMDAKIKEIMEGQVEATTQFATAQENINSVLQGSFSSLGNQIANTFGGSGTIFGAFLSNFLQTATSIMAANLATSSADAVKSGTQTALSFGPASAFVLPALVAGAVGVVSKAFSGIKKFASGGIVSTPTMGLMGEYPGARSNPEVIAPLDKLTGMLGGTQSNVQVGGEFKLRGQDLVVALQRADRNRERIK